MPDLDAIASVWLIKKFMPEWKDAPVQFVAAGSTLDKTPPDSNPDITHVDTGNGKFDHHQSNENTCATQLLLTYLIAHHLVDIRLQPALERLVAFVNLTDHFGEVRFPDAPADIYDFSLHQLINGLNHTMNDSNMVIAAVFPLLEATLQNLRNKVRAEEEIKKGQRFQSKWGDSLIMETRNEEAMKLAMKMGINLVIRKDPRNGGVRIKSLPSKTGDLTELYEAIIKKDTVGKWYLHPSKNVLLNTSSINPALIPTQLTLPDIIEIIGHIH